MGGCWAAQRLWHASSSWCSPPQHPDQVPAARYLGKLKVADVLQAVADFYDVPRDSFSQPRTGSAPRDVADWLTRRSTPATLRGLAPHFGLTHPESVSNLVRRAERLLGKSPRFRNNVERLRTSLEKH